MNGWYKQKHTTCFALTIFLSGMFQAGMLYAEQRNGGNTASGLTWHWRYDLNGRLAEVEAPGNVTTRLTYNSSKTSAEQETSNTIDFFDEQRIFKHDSQGRLLDAIGSGGKVSFDYNASGLPSEVRSSGAPILQYTYNIQNRLISMDIGNKAAIKYRYDYLGRLAAITTPAGNVTFSYHRATSTVVRRLPNGWQTMYHYNDEGKLVELTHSDSKNHIIAKYTYRYRPDQLIEAVTEMDQRYGKQECSYQYDLMHRLTDVQCEGKERWYRYRYDALGNLAESQNKESQTVRFTSTPAGALATDSRGVTRIDERGHIRQLPNSKEPNNFEYNGAGELSSAMGQNLRYTYNALGLLTSRTIAGRKTNFLPDPFAEAWHPLWRRNADGTEALIVWDGAVPLLELQDTQVRYRLEDHLGSIRLELDNSGNIIDWHDYTPYGVPEAIEVSHELIPAFAGLFWDPDAKVYLTMARAYDPISARFLQPDPQLRLPNASKHNHSLYAYCGGDPVNFVDRNGAEARETISFDASQRRWDSFRRSYLYESLGWFRKLFIKESDRSPLTVITDPNIRDSIVINLIGEAWKRSGQDIIKTHSLVKDWRENRIDRPDEYKYAVTKQEWQAAENYLYARQWVETGQGIINLPKGKIAAFIVKNIGFPYWEISHLLGETIGIRPGIFLNFLGASSGDKSWQPIMPQTREWKNRGIADALGNIKARKIMFEGPPKSFLQKIDDVIARPAYGDDVYSNPKPSLPSPVGGVYLGGSGQALQGFGQLKGVAIDDTTGKLVLIGSDDKQIALPPLRLDDVVTVFRAVFDHGRAPSVTIDPNQQYPTGPTMDVKHGPGTETSYVGWILYQCDRIMKSYQLGEDNITHTAVNSHVPGYTQTLDSVFFGHGQDSSIWERFWIVPAAVRRFDAATNDLSLFELPLKVNTQKMRWRQGKLVDDVKGQSSLGAKAFMAWFSKYYNEIADEVLLSPPIDMGFDAPIAIFHELQRIALITAMAESLRDSGQTLPMWMRDYEVSPFPVDKTTPSLALEKRKKEGFSIRTSNIFGGVNLAPADKNVRTYNDMQTFDIVTIPLKDQAFIGTSRQEAVSLSPRIPTLARTRDTQGTIQSVPIQDGKSLSAMVLPGATTRALSPNRQAVTDMVVSIGLGHSISLTRYYNSFFNPIGIVGKGWTLNLPKLLMTQVPVKRDGKRSEYRVVPHLVTPLGTVDIRFNDRSHVMPYGVEMPIAKDHPKVAGIAQGYSEIAEAETHQILFRDGTKWHFDVKGRLVLMQANGTGTRYVWDVDNRVKRIVGYLGRDALATIQLGYDLRGRIIEAKAKRVEFLNKQSHTEISDLEFEYDDNGHLRTVVSIQLGKSKMRSVQQAYSYEGNHLSKINDNGSDISFGYDKHGRMLWEKYHGLKTEYSVTTTPQRTVLTKVAGNRDIQSAKWTYDERMRLLQADHGNGRLIEWKYGKSNNVQEIHSQDGKPILIRSTSQDGKNEKIKLANGATYEIHRNGFGRPTTLLVDGTLAMQMSWQSNGVLAKLNDNHTEVRPHWHKNGWPNGLIVSAPMNSGATNQWLEEEWDIMGRPIKITDSSGFVYAVSYDDQGRLRSFGRMTDDGKLIGTKLVYGTQDLVQEIVSSWSHEIREYTNSRILKKITVERKKVKSV
ncbi:MAG: RHS repeat-associated core domain-containing protein, partial [Thiotrichaceae bacterium]